MPDKTIKYIDIKGNVKETTKYKQFLKRKKQYKRNCKNGYFDNHKNSQLKDKIFFQLLKTITEINS